MSTTAATPREEVEQRAADRAVEGVKHAILEEAQKKHVEAEQMRKEEKAKREAADVALREAQKAYGVLEAEAMQVRPTGGCRDADARSWAHV